MDSCFAPRITPFLFNMATERRGRGSSTQNHYGACSCTSVCANPTSSLLPVHTSPSGNASPGEWCVGCPFLLASFPRCASEGLHEWASTWPRWGAMTWPLVITGSPWFMTRHLTKLNNFKITNHPDSKFQPNVEGMDLIESHFLPSPDQTSGTWLHLQSFAMSCSQVTHPQPRRLKQPHPFFSWCHMIGWLSVTRHLWPLSLSHGMMKCASMGGGERFDRCRSFHERELDQEIAQSRTWWGRWEEVHTLESLRGI